MATSREWGLLSLWPCSKQSIELSSLPNDPTPTTRTTMISASELSSALGGQPCSTTLRKWAKDGNVPGAVVTQSKIYFDKELAIEWFKAGCQSLTLSGDTPRPIGNTGSLSTGRTSADQLERAIRKTRSRSPKRTLTPRKPEQRASRDSRSNRRRHASLRNTSQVTQQ